MRKRIGGPRLCHTAPGRNVRRAAAPHRAWTRMNESTGPDRDVTEKARPSHPFITFDHIVNHIVFNITLFVKEFHVRTMRIPLRNDKVNQTERSIQLKTGSEILK